jgi:hypothetical protein
MTRIGKFILCAVFLFQMAALRASPPLWLYTIDATTRGISILSAVSTAYTPVFPVSNSTQEVAIQTRTAAPFIYAPYVQNGLIPYVLGTDEFVSGPNFTMFIVPYLPITTFTIQYLVVGVEQVVDVLYSSRAGVQNPVSLSGYTSTFANEVLPLYSINPVHRAADIGFIVNTLLTDPTYNMPNVSQVWIQTTLRSAATNGFYPAFYSPGYIPYVTAIYHIPGTSYLQIYYQNRRQMPGYQGSVIVSAEQIEQIVYYPYNSAPQ